MPRRPEEIELMHEKKTARRKRIAKARARMRATESCRLCVNRTLRHMYAQILTSDGSRTLASASSLSLSQSGAEQSKTELAAKVGESIAQRARKLDIEKLVFDRAGFRYHGRVKALAEAARAGGLRF